MQNTLYSVGRLPFLVDFALQMQDRLGWEPRYWITQPELHAQVGEAFPDTVRHPFQEANRGIPAGDFTEFGVSSVNAETLERAGRLFHSALQIVDRHVLGNGLAAVDQRHFLYRQLGYCLKIVDLLKLQRFVLNSTPHSIIDICFYIACRLRGADVRMLHLTGFDGRQVVLADAEGAPLGLEMALKSRQADPDAHAPLSQSGERELSTLRESEQQIDPWYVSAQKERDSRLSHLYEAADFILDEGLAGDWPADLSQPLEIPEATLRGRKIGCPGSKPGYVNIFARRFAPKHSEVMHRSFARPGAHFRDAPITWREYYIYKDYALIQKRVLLRRYEELTADFNERRLDHEQYVYFPLHYQPERTTCPDGGWFNDQYLAAAALAEALPDGRMLLIKEHPSQFLWQTEGELGRSSDYYDPFLSLRNTLFVPIEVPSRRLIAGALAVATINGMAGWEARVCGRPVITFGVPWYCLCEGVFQVRSTEDVKAVFERVAVGDVPQAESPRLLAAAIESIGRKCYMNPSHGPLYPDLSESENCAALVELFAQAEAYSDGIVRGAP